LQLFQRNVQIDEESPESDKPKLIEIYRRTVLPLSQRTRFQCQLSNLSSIRLDDGNLKNQNPSTNINSCHPNMSGRASEPLEDMHQETNSSLISFKPAVKRKAGDMTNTNQNPITKKRQKITWP